MNIFSKIRTFHNLGISNLFRVGIYRLGIKTRLHPVLRVRATIPVGLFFHNKVKATPKNAIASSSWSNNTAKYFGKTLKDFKDIPNWFENPFHPDRRANSDLLWWQISDFDNNVGDIKTVWEASRFDWVIAMAQRAALGNSSELERLNLWLTNWVQHNSPYEGANWKCGQEASIRVLHTLLATQILGQLSNPEIALTSFIKMHLKRIAPTINYAIGQSNNHGTSEAAALFIGGSWLVSLGEKSAKKWQDLGRHWLENRARKLIENDGTFSQYSVTYHRMMLDTYCFCEVWRRNLNLSAFSKETNASLFRATDWLLQMTDKKTGDVANIGANDGAQIIPLSDSDYRDFRPTVQLACVLFQDKIIYCETGLWDQSLIWLDVERAKDKVTPPQSISMDKGGLHILRKAKAVTYLRYPRFRFRPSQADALHCDLWVNGENILRDGGTYSYNCSQQDMSYFSGTKSHNTIEFDERDQMPKIGRFLYGDWLKAKDVELVFESENNVTATAAYYDYQGAYHNRHLDLSEKQLICTDKVAGFKKKAILRWRLIPSDWKLENNILSDGIRSISVHSSVEPTCIRLTQGEESRYYLQKTPIQVLEIEVNRPATLTTRISF